mmetsp:Transcript_406/g.805  ORF Transcript_406/g.805 Transcript_406/m.805 type:complete len:431 (-) Transcript_406:42-1334(-)
MTTTQSSVDQANSTKNNEHEEFEAFLEEVEQLSLKFSDKENPSHHPSDGGNPCEETVVDDDANKPRCQDYIETEAKEKTLSAVKTRERNKACEGINVKTSVKKKNHNNLSRQEKQNRIRLADENRSAWNEFKNLDLSAPSKGNNSGGDSEGKPKISFQIMKEKNTKKKKKRDAAKGGKEFIPDSAKAPNFSNDDHDKYADALSTPKWILVMDTCCLIQDNGMAAQKLIDLANQTFNARYIAEKHAHENNHAAILATSVEEPIEIVIPHKVWSELEFQSKSQDSRTAYFARSVIRMLRDELTQCGSNGVPGYGNDNGKILRSQSLLQSRHASSKFLSLDRISAPTNDDHILACALLEHDHWTVSASSSGSDIAARAGGVVLVTTDGNLTCKALANKVKVYSPSSFHDYYVRRMESLRKRAVQSLAGSALRL